MCHEPDEMLLLVTSFFTVEKKVLGQSVTRIFFEPKKFCVFCNAHYVGAKQHHIASFCG